MNSFNNTKKNSVSSHHQNILNSPSFPELEFRQTKASLNRSFIDETREKQNVTKFTLGETLNPFNTVKNCEKNYANQMNHQRNSPNDNALQTSLRIEDLKIKKNHSLRYREESLQSNKVSMKEKMFKQKIEEDRDYCENIENLGVGYQNIINNNNNSQNQQCTVKFRNLSEKNSVQTFNTESMSFDSEQKEFEIQRKCGSDYTKIFIPVKFLF